VLCSSIGIVHACVEKASYYYLQIIVRIFKAVFIQWIYFIME